MVRLNSCLSIPGIISDDFKMRDFLSKGGNLGYGSDFTTESQEALTFFHKFFICWLLEG